MLKKQEKRIRRHKRVRSKIFGTAKIPRLCVFRSAKHIYAQIINDEKRKTLASAKDSEIKPVRRSPPASPRRSRSPKGEGGKTKAKKVDVAKELGKLIAKKAIEKKINKVVFDRGGYKYHGRVKALAEAAREAGLKF